MSQTFPLTSGANQIDGRAWINRNQTTGTPATPDAGHQDSSITLSGAIHGLVAAVAEIQVVSYSGTPAVGDTLVLGVGGAVYSHVCAGVETLQDCLDALVTASGADTSVWTCVRSGDTIECTAATAGITDSVCAGIGLCTKVVASFTGTPVAGDVVSLALASKTYNYTVVTGNTIANALDAVVTLAANDPNWAVARATNTLVCQAKYPTNVPSEVRATCSHALASKVVGTFAGAAAVGDYIEVIFGGAVGKAYVVETADALTVVLDAVAAFYANNTDFTIARSGNTLVATPKNSSVVPALDVTFSVTTTSSLALSSTVTSSTFTGSSFAVSKAATVGDLATSFAVGTPGVAEIAASVFSVALNGVDYIYTVQTGDTLNDAAIALDVLIAVDYTTDGPPAAATINFYGLSAVPTSFVDSSSGLAVAVFTLVSPANDADPVNSASASFWRTARFNSVEVVSELVSGTSYKITPWLYNAAANAWTALADITVTATKTTVIDTTPADGIFMELKTFVGSGVASVTLVGPHA